MDTVLIFLSELYDGTFTFRDFINLVTLFSGFISAIYSLINSIAAKKSEKLAKEYAENANQCYITLTNSILKNNILDNSQIVKHYKETIKKDFGTSRLYINHETYVLYDEIVDYFKNKYENVDIPSLDIALQELAPKENIKTYKFDFRKIMRFV